jgi:hypothetical protein
MANIESGPDGANTAEPQGTADGAHSNMQGLNPDIPIVASGSGDGIGGNKPSNLDYILKMFYEQDTLMSMLSLSDAEKMIGAMHFRNVEYTRARAIKSRIVLRLWAAHNSDRPNHEGLSKCLYCSLYVRRKD